MATHPSRALDQARSINSNRLFVLLCFVGVLAIVRLVVYPIADTAFVMLAFWMLAGLLYDLGMKKMARIIPAVQAVMFALDITLLTILPRVVA